MEFELTVAAVHYLIGLEDGETVWTRSFLFQTMVFNSMEACENYAETRGDELADFLVAALRDYWIDALNLPPEDYRMDKIIDCSQAS